MKLPIKDTDEYFLHFSKRRISTLLTIIALVLWSISICQTKLVIDKLGLINGFPILFFFSLGILTLSSAILWCSKENHWFLLLIQLIILVISLYIPYLFVGGVSPLYSESYGHLGWAEYIYRVGRLNPEALWQHCWPGVYILESLVLQISGGNIDNLANFLPWLPVIWQLLWVFPLFVFFKNVFKKEDVNYCWAAIWIFCLWNWIGQQNDIPAPFGIFCMLGTFAILAHHEIWENNTMQFKYILIIIILVAVNVIGHFLSSLVLLMTIVGLTISQKIATPKLILIISIFICAWSMYGASGFLSDSLPALLQTSTRLDLAIQQGIINPISGNEARAVVSIIRIVFSGLLLIIAFLGGILAFKKEKLSSDKALLFMILMNIPLLIFIGVGYNREVFLRFFLYFLPYLAYFSIRLLKFKYTAIFLTFIFIFCLPLSFISQHGNQKMDYLSTGYLSGASFFHSENTHGWLFAFFPVGRMNHMENYSITQVPIDFSQLTWRNNEMINRYPYTPDYFCISNHDSEIWSYLMNEPEYIDNLQTMLDITTNINLIFVNKDFRMYMRQALTPPF